MLLLIEGCDKAGKSTIVRELRKTFPRSVQFKNMIKPEDREQTTIGRIAGIYLGAYQFAKQIQERNNTFHTIFDRGHITEIVYSHRRGYESTKSIDWLRYERELLSSDTVLIYVSAPPTVIRERFETDKETYIDQAEIEGILERYEDYLRITEIPTLKLSSLDAPVSNLIKIVQFIDKQYNI